MAGKVTKVKTTKEKSIFQGASLLSGDRRFPVLSGDGQLTLPERGRKAGYWAGEVTEILSGNDCSAAVVITPDIRIRITQLNGILKYRALGAGPAIFAPFQVAIAPYVATSQGFIQLPARQSASVITPQLADSRSFRFYSGLGEAMRNISGVILEANQTYELSISSDYRTWQATDSVTYYAGFNWEIA